MPPPGPQHAMQAPLPVLLSRTPPAPCPAARRPAAPWPPPGPAPSGVGRLGWGGSGGAGRDRLSTPPRAAPPRAAHRMPLRRPRAACGVRTPHPAAPTRHLAVVLQLPPLRAALVQPLPQRRDRDLQLLTLRRGRLVLARLAGAGVEGREGVVNHTSSAMDKQERACSAGCSAASHPPAHPQRGPTSAMSCASRSSLACSRRSRDSI
jgi:hypothetical protein